mmetsp:Transcript_25340/g.75270  ORF Transcript_25340/g.75270 Transcript_25340/m.75270 type:complete len:304 (-) Transcript_25340:91-1002(-)
MTGHRESPPSIDPGSARAEQIRGGPLADALLPTARLEAPPFLEVDLGSLRDEAGARLVARAIAERGLCQCRCGLSPELGAAAAAEAASLYADGELAPRGFVKEGRRVPPDPEQQTDLCAMLTDDPGHRLHAKTQALLALDAAIERLAVETVAQLGLLDERDRGPLGGGPNGEPLSFSSRGDLMVAVYPGGGSFHRVHIDNADGDGRAGRDFGRVLTFIYFLNAGWTEEDGGALRLHIPRACEEGGPSSDAAAARAAGRSPAVDVIPRLDTLAVFRADRVMHEVRPCPGRHRYAASVWVTCGGG